MEWQNDASKPDNSYTSGVSKYYSDKSSLGASTSLSAGINSATGKPSNPKPYRARQMDVGSSPARSTRASRKRGRAGSHHAANPIFRQQRGPALLEQRIGRLGDVAPRVHERAVKIEHDEAKTIDVQLSRLRVQGST